MAATGWPRAGPMWRPTAFSMPPGELFATHGVTSVGMNEIAEAAGCSRATLYRYFENREALRTPYVNRETNRVHQQMIDQINGIKDPRERLIAGVANCWLDSERK